MEKIKIKLLSHKILAIVLGILAIGSVAMAYYGGSPKNVMENVVYNEAQDVPNGENLGAQPSPDILFPYSSVNGIRRWYYKNGLGTATNTPCSIKSPYATSTLISFWTNFITATATAATVNYAKAATPYATTTTIGSPVLLAAGAQASYVGTTTTANIQLMNNVFAPSQYLNLFMQNTIQNPSFSPTGNCAAVFEEIL